ncbi:MAG TPA: hypothetical protein VGR66_06295 [Candidatus Eisenbacteria bacterium]|nr:hypothetical protein [Candidatus Eisenbacteria bacterium]
MRLRKFAGALALAFVLFGCKSSTEPKTTQPPALVANDTPAHAIERLISSYEKKNESAFAGMFTGDYTYEFSVYTDPTLVQQYSTGWFKSDETASSTHLFSGYTPPGGSTLEPASSISIALADSTPTDDNASGVDPATHKVLATRVDGQIVVPNPGADPTAYNFQNNFNVFYIVRGDSAVGLGSGQSADSLHWYVYRWVDQTSGPGTNRPQTVPATWGKLKGMYH